MRIKLGVSFEGSIFIRETHNPAVGVGALHGNVEHFSRQDVGGADTAADHRRPGPVDTRIRSLSPAKAKLHNAVPSGGINHPGRLGGDQALMVDDIQNRSLHQLRLHHRSDHLQKWLPGKYHCSLRDGVDISREMKSSQILQKIILKKSQAPQILHVIGGEMQIPHIFNYLLQTRRYGKAAVAGILPVKRIKNHHLFRGIFEISLHHGQLIQICQ